MGAVPYIILASGCLVATELMATGPADSNPASTGLYLALLFALVVVLVLAHRIKRFWQPSTLNLYLNSGSHTLCLTLNNLGHILAIDHEGSDILGYATDELAGLRFSELLAPSYHSQIGGLLRSLQSDNLAEGFQLILMHKNGIPVHLTLSNNQNYQQQHEADKERLRFSHKVLESLPDHISVVSPDYRYRHVNNTYLLAHGLERAHIEGRPVAELLGEDIFKAVVKPNLDRCLTGEEVHYENWFEFRRAGKCYMSVSYYPLRGLNNSIDGVTVISRDTTTEKLATDNLRLFRELMEHSNDGLIIVDPGDGHIIDVNERTISNLGYTRDELLGMRVPEISTALTGAQGWEHFRDEIKADGHRLITAKHRRKDGSYLYIEASVRYIELDDQDYLLGLVRDISERWETDKQLRLARSVLENTPESVMITDRELKILSVNPAFTETTGYSEEEVKGQTPRLLSSGRHDKAFYHEMWSAIGQTGHWEGEIWNRRKNGEIYPEWLSINTIKDAQNEVCFYAAFFSDSTSQVHVRKRLHTLAYYDALTTLPNRALFNDRLINALINAERDRVSVALLFLDIDHFKVINDSYGHIIGDELLRQVAERLRTATRASDTVARLAGDEFTVIVPGLDNDADVTIVAEKIIETFRTPFTLGDNILSISTSIGISLYPQDAKEAQALLALADAAMYQAKSAGRNRYVHYSQIGHERP